MNKLIFKILYIVTIVFLVISWLKIKELPPRNEIVSDLLKEPIQAATVREGFTFSYTGKNYSVKPVFDYELWGLVVSQNNIRAWYNYYHDKNSVNLKDICVVWGKNVENGVYRDSRMDYSSGEWTCYVNWSGELKSTFYADNLSNNHLLAASLEVQKVIKDIRVGDQIHLRGSLVDYVEVGQPWYRMTSISRKDSNSDSRSGGACEVVYVDKMEILKKNQVFWHNVNQGSKITLIALVVTQLFLFLWDYKIFLKKDKL